MTQSVIVVIAVYVHSLFRIRGYQTDVFACINTIIPWFPWKVQAESDTLQKITRL